MGARGGVILDFGFWILDYALAREAYGWRYARARNRKSKIENPKWSIVMDEREFKRRTKAVALRVIRLVEALPKSKTAQTIGGQLLRSGTSVGANYRAACRGKSPADVIAKLGIVEEEADEAGYWLELLSEAGIMTPKRLEPLMAEMDEIVRMVVASIRTMRARNPRK
jgi:four helix bundle protein